MSLESFKTFAEQVRQDELLRAEIRRAGGAHGIPARTLAEIARGHGYDFTADEVDNELGEAAADDVVGEPAFGPRVLHDVAPPRAFELGPTLRYSARDGSFRLR